MPIIKAGSLIFINTYIAILDQMKFTHISAFTIVALTTSVHAILPQPSETIDSVDPSPSPSLNSQSVPQATGGPEFPSTSTTQGPGGSQGDHSNQTPRVRLKSSKLRLGYQGGDYGLADHVEENSRQQQLIEVIAKGINAETSKFKKHLLSFSAYLGEYEVWVKNILNFLDGFEAISKLSSEFINGLGKIFKEFLEIIHVLYESIYQIVLHLNEDSGLLENAVKAMLDLTDQFMSRQTDLQQLFKELFERYSKIDWYYMHLGLELALWLQKFKTSMQRYNA
ncbi:hypothetical protein BDEG_21111 [Batrachochytrium dendrobatidis JEL423]|uniref:Uncharacterized protein n=1 Tax=Batrachochytrium dendrobatidis (strain JEL423) TaxID=403673 RepID=A0A177WB68_BATDL|nr:hypothetical protein BDEG_21111 [Batrachochytrium dendrobatidis JEL423]